jgi:hypothetical protein
MTKKRNYNRHRALAAAQPSAAHYALLDAVILADSPEAMWEVMDLLDSERIIDLYLHVLTTACAFAGDAWDAKGIAELRESLAVVGVLEWKLMEMEDHFPALLKASGDRQREFAQEGAN